MSTALEGLIVLDLGQIYQGPYSTLMLAFQGATVIKIEPLGGENLRLRRRGDAHELLMLNSNKRGICLNLKSEEGKSIFLDLVKKADVVVENYAVGVMDRLGLGYDVLNGINPRLIYATGKGYGLDGPYAERLAMDLTIQAIGGVMATTGFPDMPPVKAGPAICDFLGGIHLFGGITTALYHREKTGKGQLVEVSMHDAVYPTLASALGAYYNGNGKVPQRTGNQHSGMSTAPYNVYPCEDGHMAIMCVADRQWEALAKVMGRDELIEDPRFKTNVDRSANTLVVDDIVSSWTSKNKKLDIAEKLARVNVPNAPVLSIPEVADDPHLIHRKMIREVEHPVAGNVRVPGSPIRLSDSPLDQIFPAPLLGQHTNQVLREYLDFSEEQLSHLREKQAIK
jgi:crotonobetainyl-CoA:carnitine CoA-transferase CaiB-like acyl-CoA transferase